jgi:alkanesulfonate monooxygenase SsuD/methylene tetrahydromethanopterin reductase-like flavin-dependent oxidoreductase (luciferase family)
MSLNLNPGYVKSHWDSVEAGAAKTGRTPFRGDWRLVREILVAETDEQAWELSVRGPMGRMMQEYFLPLLANFGFLEYLKHDPDVPDEAVTVEYCARHNWLVGSPETVAKKLEAVYDDVGGFGCLLVFGFDYVENPAAWHNSLRLIAEEVKPRVAHLSPKPATAAVAD